MIIRMTTALLLGLAAPASADSARAQLLAGGCIGCHGASAAGSQSVPGIARTKTRAEFLATMAAFRANERENTIMGRVTRGYTDEEIALLAAHFARPE